MKLSVIIPVYNTRKLVRKCIDSILAQKFKGIEIILVDDGSTDDSLEILREYEKKYPESIVVLTKKNGGQGSARNLGLRIAKGDYITFVDSDDTIAEGMYQEMYDMAIKEKCDIVICGVQDYYEKNGYRNNRSLFNKKNIPISEAIVHSIPAVWNKIYKKSLFKGENMFFNESNWYEDFPLSMQLLMKAKKVCYIDKPFYQYYHRIRSSIHNDNIVRNLDIIKDYKEVVNFATKYNYYNKYDEEIHYLLLKEVYISTINRVIRTNNPASDKRKIIKEIKKYCKEAHLRKTKYFKEMPRAFRLSYYLIKLNMYSLINLLFKIKEKNQ